MNIYFASAFAHKDRVKRLVALAKHRLGAQVPDEWCHVDYKARGAPPGMYAAIAARHFRSIRECDALVLVSGAVPHKFTGANVEVGYALALGKPVFGVGILEDSAMYAPAMRCDTDEELMLMMRTYFGG